MLLGGGQDKHDNVTTLCEDTTYSNNYDKHMCYWLGDKINMTMSLRYLRTSPFQITMPNECVTGWGMGQDKHDNITSLCEDITYSNNYDEHMCYWVGGKINMTMSLPYVRSPIQITMPNECVTGCGAR